jgi:precorrin-8X/cobalt-precorrin-8 methylmutase
MPEFDTYLMIDWSASNVPATGRDSIWYCLVTRTGDRLAIEALENPRTRYQATAELRRLLVKFAREGRSVLAGFDFPFGYPAGFAQSLGFAGQPPWRAVWQHISRTVVDSPDNRNNRFEAAAEFNRRISGGPYPFWGCPETKASAALSCTKPPSGALVDKRATDTGSMQPIWKLYGNGSVGSQALVGIPCVAALRDDPALALVSRVWPFETGLRSKIRGDGTIRIVFAEIYPSLLPAALRSGEVKDAAQVRTMAEHFAGMDTSGDLSALFEGANLLSSSNRTVVEQEEGWALGAGGKLGGMVRLTFVADLERSAVAANQGDHPRRRAASKTTQPGYENRNGQVVVRATGVTGTDHGQYVYLLRCSGCAHEYGANGSDIFQRKCPNCQRGASGLPCQ